MAKFRPKLSIKMMAADWSLRDYPSEKRPWSVETKVKKVKEAGFDGMSAGADPALGRALAKHGLELVGGVDVGSVRAAEPTLKRFQDDPGVKAMQNLGIHGILNFFRSGFKDIL